MKKEHLSIYFFMTTMIVYFLIFLLTLYNYSKKMPTIDIGMDYKTLNITIMVLCVIGILKTLYMIKRY